MRSFLLAAAALAAAMLAATAAARTAPLPPHWMPEDQPEDEGAEPRPMLRGLYGSGVSDPKPQSARDHQQNDPRGVCRGGLDEQQAWLDRLGDFLTEFWFYSTRTQSVAFLRSVEVRSDAGCSEPLRYAHRIERGFIADGFFHRMIIEPDGSATSFDTRQIGSSEPDTFWGFAPFEAIATRSVHRLEGASMRETVAGLPARCRESGFAHLMSRVCVSRSGPSRGLPLAMGTGDDTSQLVYWTEFRAVMPEAELDPRLFDLHRVWRAPR